MRWNAVEVAFQSVREGLPPYELTFEAGDQGFRGLVGVVHVCLDFRPPEYAIGVIDYCARRLQRVAMASGRWQQPPGQLARPSATLPKPAHTEDVIWPKPMNRPDAKALEVPGSDVCGQAGPCCARRDRPAICGRCSGIGIEVFVGRFAVRAKCSQPEAWRQDGGSEHRRGVLSVAWGLELSRAEGVGLNQSLDASDELVSARLRQ